MTELTETEREIADLKSRLACVMEATYWDRPYDTRIAAIRGMCDLSTDGMSPADPESPLAAARAEGARDMARRLDDLVEGRVMHQGGWYGERSHEQLKTSLRSLVRALLADGGEPQPEQVQPCGLDAGSRPYWMGVDQYDPCPCVRPKGHDGEHGCADHDKPTDAVGGEPQ